MKGLSTIKKQRITKETNISISLGFCDEICPSHAANLSIDTQVPFFTHMLHAMLFHGGWTGSIEAKGDVDIDEHHLIEDTGIVLGQICAEYAFAHQPCTRFGHAIIPMDDALAECTIDFSNRAFLYYNANFPQARIGAGGFDVSLAREFFTAFAHNAHINLHIEMRHGINSHHILEAIFKSCGRALRDALQSLNSKELQSTKGTL